MNSPTSQPGTPASRKEQVSGDQPSARNSMQPEEGFGGKEASPRIVIAEDDDEMRSLLTFTLQREGYKVVECKDGLEALDHVGGPPIGWLRIGLLISDIRMPGATGLEVLRRQHEAGAEVPVILITGFGDRQTHEEAQRLGAVAVFDKPFDLSDLLCKVRQVLPLQTWERTDPRPRELLRFEGGSLRFQVCLPAQRSGIPRAVEKATQLIRRSGTVPGKELYAGVAVCEALQNAIVNSCGENPARNVLLNLDCHPTRGLSIRVRDSGSGFDAGSLDWALPEEMKACKWLLLIRLLMDDIHVEEGGREIQMTLR